MNGLADVYGLKICIQVCMWLGFPPLIIVVTGVTIASVVNQTDLDFAQDLKSSEFRRSL